MEKKLKLISLIVSGVFTVAAVVFVSLGFYKMFVYENPDRLFADTKNAYVGGDAYNYIINANYATGYFVLALICIVIVVSALIYHRLLVMQ